MRQRQAGRWGQGGKGKARAKGVGVWQVGEGGRVWGRVKEGQEGVPRIPPVGRGRRDG